MRARLLSLLAVIALLSVGVAAPAHAAPLSPVTITLTASTTDATVGDTVTLTATVTGNPIGTVTFFTNNGWGTVYTSFPGSPPALVNHAASVTLSTSIAGSHEIIARFTDDSNDSIFSAKLPVSFRQPSVTQLSISGTSTTAGSPVQLDATVFGINPTGNVEFFTGSTSLGTAAMVGGTANLAVSSLSAGAHAVTAVYSGDSNNTASSSAPVTVTVGPAITNSSTSLTASPSSIFAGDYSTVTATVTGSNPTGDVQFFLGSSQIIIKEVLDGKAVLNLYGIPVGTNTFTARYIGDENNSASSSAAVTVTVAARPTTTTLTAAPSTVTVGENTTLTASVTGFTPGGTVEFFNGSASLGTATVSSGTASLAVSGLAVGTHRLTAVYSGDNSNAPSTSPSDSVTVLEASSSTTLTASPDSATVGENTTLTASVTGFTPGGTVEFFNGSASLGTATVSSGTASLRVTGLGQGKHVLTAVYSGDNNNATSTSPAINFQVNTAASNTTLTVSPSTVTVGEKTTLTASVTGLQPSGTVEFFNGTTSLGTATLTPQLPALAPRAMPEIINGSATLTLNSLPVGTHRLTAVYSGDSSNAPSTSSTATVTVVAASSSTSLAASPDSVTVGESTTLTASVTGFTPGGTVEFFNGATSLGTATVKAGKASLPVSSLAVGTHRLTAVYAGDDNNLSSTSSVVTVTIAAVPPVAPSPTSVSLTAAPGTSGFGGALLTAIVTGINPVGTVEFFNGTTSLGTATLGASTAAPATLSLRAKLRAAPAPIMRTATATLAVNSLPAGTHSFTAVYAGNSSNAASTAAPATITIAENPVSITVAAPRAPAAPSASLPSTGLDPFAGGAAALLLLVLGGSALLIYRRRETTNH